MLRRLRGRAAMSLGRASSLRPLAEDFGFSRGQPIDRFYIEAFLHEHRSDIAGRVLEVGDDSYSRRFGGSRIMQQDVLHVHEGAAGATICGDISQAGTLPGQAFDCVIFTQTLHLIFDMPAALAALHEALRPGGVLLVTVPGVSSVDRADWQASWYWSLTERALAKLLSSSFETDQTIVKSFGNLFAATAFLHGAAVEDTGTRRLLPRDPAYPVIVAARARRSG